MRCLTPAEGAPRGSHSLDRQDTPGGLIGAGTSSWEHERYNGSERRPAELSALFHKLLLDRNIALSR